MSQYINQVGYGLTSALPVLAPYPIKANRIPTTADNGYPVGQIWIYSAGSAAYILVSVVSNVALWQLVAPAGGGSFSTLTSTGATTLATTGASVNTFGNTTGATSLSLRVGTGNFSLDGVAASTYSIGASTVGGNITIGGTAQTGAITLGSSSASQTVNIGTGTGTSTIDIGTNAGGQAIIQIGNTAATSALLLEAGSTGGIGISAGGNVLMTPGTVSAAAYAATVQANVGQVTLTGQVLASGASQVLTITNGFISATSPVFVTVSNLGSNDAQLTVQRVQPKAGSLEVTVKNNGAAALNGNIHVTFWAIA